MYGMAILSRFHVKDTHRLIFERSEAFKDEELVFMDKEEQPRGAMAALLQPGEAEQPFWVVNTHFSHRCASQEQRAQARQLMAWLDSVLSQSEWRRCVLCGDFNSLSFLPGTAYSTIVADERYRDLARSGSFFHWLTAETTFPLLRSCGFRLDYILSFQAQGQALPVSDGVRAVRDCADDVKASDHYAVVASLHW